MARTKRPGLPGVFVCTNKEETAMVNYTFMIVTLIALLVIVGGITFFGVNLSNEQYDRLKGIVIKWSGITTFLGVIVATFKAPYGNETITLVAAIGALLAYALNVSIKNYVDGAVPGEDGGVDADDDL